MSRWPRPNQMTFLDKSKDEWLRAAHSHTANANAMVPVQRCDREAWEEERERAAYARQVAQRLRG